MKNILTFSLSMILMLAMLAACSSDDLIAAYEPGDGGDGNTDAVTALAEEEVLEGTQAVKHDLEFDDLSRSLYFNGSVMKMQWNSGDKIAIYPLFVEDANQAFKDGGAAASPRQIFEYVQQTGVSDNTMRGSFGPEGTGKSVVLNVENSDKFLAWSPYLDVDDRRAPAAGYTAIPVTYQNQVQSENVKMGHYITSDEEEMAKYYASEKKAAEHLTAFDYMYAAATQNPTSKYTLFEFQHLQATVCFYISIPETVEPQVYDSLIIVNTFNTDTPEYLFKDKMTFNLGTQTATYTSYPRKLKITFGASGFDMRKRNDDGKLVNSGNIEIEEGDDGAVYDPEYIHPKGGARIVAYMEMYPVNLNEDVIPAPTLYLCSHRTKKVGGETVTEKFFYKNSSPMAKKKILAGKLYQWTMAGLDEEEPITFEVLQVQNWTDDVTYTNGDDGNGTANW